ncbi:MAG: hypothetical protein GQ569_00650 [Methylococcaceae bacterium]|nr:hypothetical protein [Methylococcaceae bacterium]
MKKYFGWAVLIIIMIAIILAVLIPSYCDYMPRAKWAKAVTTITPLKLAIAECLNDNKGEAEYCQSVQQLKNYGIEKLPAVFDNNINVAEINLATIQNHKASIVITGNKDTLLACTFAFIPIHEKTSGYISWVSISMENPNGDEKDCTKYVKGSQTLAEFNADISKTKQDEQATRPQIDKDDIAIHEQATELPN